MNSSHTIWVERWRPTTLDGYVGDDLVRQKIEEYIRSQDIPHLLFHGTAGTGKTTAAKILVNNINCDHLFINASDERGIDTVRDKIKSFASTAGFNPLKIIVLDEADFLGREAQPALRNLMEAYSETTRFILTANYIERIIEPLISRTQVYKLLPPSKKEVARRLTQILREEQVEYDTETVVKLVKTYYPDVRKIINTAQLQTKDKRLVLNLEDIRVQDVKRNMIDMLTSNAPAATKTNQVRQLVADNKVQDFTELYRELYDRVDKYAPTKIPQTIGAIAEGMFRDAQVSDKEIIFVATLYNILTL
jgi:DNA polymerase III delta prime subunit